MVYSNTNTQDPFSDINQPTSAGNKAQIISVSRTGQAGRGGGLVLGVVCRHMLVA